MKHELEVEMLVGINLQDLQQTTKPPFSADVIDFLSALSTSLLQTPIVRDYPDIVGFAYWCRKSSLLRLKSGFDNTFKRLGRGFALHITPSNVPVNFAFSLAIGMLAGNVNVVRVSSTYRPQVKLICDAINNLLEVENHKYVGQMIKVISYQRDDLITEQLSSRADARMIWGGDETIRTIRSIVTQPRCVDVCFADRYSLCMLNAEAVNVADFKTFKNLLTGFYNDSFLFDQNACSSPHLVLWEGEAKEVESAQKRFWSGLVNLLTEKPSPAEIHSMEKFMQVCRVAIKLDNVQATLGHKNLVTRVQLRDIPLKIEDLRGRYGFFIEATDNSLQNFAKIVTNKYQTVTYFGVDPERIRECVINKGLPGVDRIVPVGDALNIDTVWDGYDLISTLSRIVVLK